MTAFPFDTLKLAEALRNADFTEAQANGAAHALAEQMHTALATKTDLRELYGDVKADLRELRADMKVEFAKIRTEMARLKADLLRAQNTALGVQTIVILVGLIGVVVTVLHLKS